MRNLFLSFVILLTTFSAHAVTYKATLTHNKEESWELFSKTITMEVSESEITLFYESIENPVCFTSQDQEIQAKVSVDCLENHMNIYFKDMNPEDVLGTVYVLIEGDTP